MNELDQYVKHTLRVKHYARYTDDFLIISHERKYLADMLSRIERFLRERLRLEQHPKKISIRPYHRGIDFLGYVIFPYHILVRTTTKRRIMRKLKERVRLHRRGEISEEALFGSLRSYLGVLSHADAHEVRDNLLNEFWFRLTE